MDFLFLFNGAAEVPGAVEELPSSVEEVPGAAEAPGAVDELPGAAEEVSGASLPIEIGVEVITLGEPRIGVVGQLEDIKVDGAVFLGEEGT